MSIEKKSLISNRTATKKALVTKPEVSSISATKLAKPKMAAVQLTRVAEPRITGVASPRVAVKTRLRIE